MNSTLNSSQANEALALLPMFIPGCRTPVLPAGAHHGGISLSIHSPDSSLYMVIDPPRTLATTLAIGDSVELFANGKPTSVIKNIRKGEENDRIEMELPWGWLVDGANTLFYRVTRPSGNADDSTPVMNVLFHYPACEITVSHPPSASPTQPATFTFARNYPRQYDEVRLTVGVWSKTIAYVHPANPITYTLTTAELKEIGDGTHQVNARIVDQLGNSQVSATGSIVINTKPLEWEDHYTSLADYAYNGWITHTDERFGSIRQFRMSNQWVTAFFNFTDVGAPTGFAGAVLYRDFTFIPGQYRFTFEGTHVADSPSPELINPILCAATSLVTAPGDRREVPKNGIWYLFLNAFTITERQEARLYITNSQDGSHGNDFGIRNIKVMRVNTQAGGLMSAPEADPELAVYTGQVPCPALPGR
ncbi:hypothetical protein [Pseudomonas syringae]|uniref:hypothetical protein n=1 Tax=Pseudomonas syringae TaxID=317 RepID=UPI001F3CE06A|nr:hypothetical protein [Pseudomonas syringae]MCF5703161.1 hypothetical protein [Pseudomonas syringae]